MSNQSHNRSSVLAITLSVLWLGALALIWMWPLAGRRHLVANLVGTYLLTWWLALSVFSEKRGEIGARFLLVSGALCVAWLFLEGAALAGLLDYRRFLGVREGPSWLLPGNTFDEELLFAREPNLTVTSKGNGNIARIWCLEPSEEGFTYTFTGDDNGFRNDRDYDRAQIAVIGDSFVEGDATPDSLLFTTHLQDLSGSTVANLGRADYGPQQELIVLRRYGLPLEPATVVWMFYENDVTDYLRYEEVKNRMRDGNLRAQPTRWERSFTYNMIDFLYHGLRGCRSDPGAQRKSGRFLTAQGGAVRMYFVKGLEPLGPRELQMLRGFGGLLEQAYAETSARGIDLVVAFIPDKLRVYAGFLEFPRHSDLFPVEPNELPARLRDIVREVSPSIGFVDLTPALVAEAARGIRVYWAQDTHWRPEGQGAAAAALWEYLGPRQGGPGP